MKKIFILLFLFLALFTFYFYNKNKYDFNLISEFSDQTTLKNFKNQKLIVYFGYTYCPDVCPTTLTLVSSALNDINNTNIKLLFISLDLKRDNNISKINDYVRYFYKNSQALLAKNTQDLNSLTKNYGVIYNKINLKNSHMKYSIAHSNKIYLIDENGKFVKAINDLYPENLKQELTEFSNK